MLMNAMSIDLEDWYHCLDPNPARWGGFRERVEPSVNQILEILDETGTRVTFFVLGHVAERHPQLVWKIHAAGHEIASHGYAHEFVYGLSPGAFETDVRRSLYILDSIVHQPIIGYRAPYFSITRDSLWALQILRRLGFAYDSSIFPVLNHRYGIPDAPRLPHPTESGLKEVPLTCYPLGLFNVPCSGGVYFRILPYEATRSMFKRMANRGEPINFYLHPWEIDPDQPRVPLPMGLRLRHYWGLDRTANKLRRLLRDFSFGPIRGLLEL
jgi:polysaccharide deacetylase family protein (PEP-CTERM system associated)